MGTTQQDATRDIAERALALSEAAMATAGNVAEVASHLRNLEKKLESQFGNDNAQVASINALRKNLADGLAEVNAIVARHNKLLAKKPGTGMSALELRMAEILTGAMADEFKRGDRELADIRSDLKSIAAGFNASLAQMKQLNGTHVTAAAHALQTEARHLSSAATAKTAGTVQTSGMFERELIGAAK